MIKCKILTYFTNLFSANDFRKNGKIILSYFFGIIMTNEISASVGHHRNPSPVISPSTIHT